MIELFIGNFIFTGCCIFYNGGRSKFRFVRKLASFAIPKDAV
ncbi:hypothetical protein [[Ruminococcus] torques]|nr:hypothetical protein [[Ruminococcus] torques]